MNQRTDFIGWIQPPGDYVVSIRYKNNAAVSAKLKVYIGGTTMMNGVSSWWTLLPTNRAYAYRSIRVTRPA